MKEKDFQTKFKRSFDLYCSNNDINGHYWKTPDCGFLNPYDCFTVTEEGFTAFELKVNRSKNTFNFYQLFGRGNQYHEIGYLRRVRGTNHKSWVVIAHKQPNGRYTAYYVHPDQADEWFQRRKGIKMEEFLEYAKELDRIKNEFRRELLYDLTPLL